VSSVGRMARALGLRSLLVPISDNVESEQAMDTACRLAADRGATIAVVNVVEVPPVLPLDSHMTSEEAVAHRLLERAAAIGHSYGVTVVPRIVCARTAADVIVAQARQRGTELIVIGAPRKRRRAFGSTVEHVLKKAPCRVLVIGAAGDSASLAQNAAA
jgi:nucleotide-binding universal stress UspA family protein